MYKGWEYRVTKGIRTHRYGRYDPAIFYGISKVHIREDGKVSYLSNLPVIMTDSVEELEEEIKKMQECLSKEVIDSDIAKIKEKN
jgi:hypothetical protein